jgi:hypothetical protein
VLNDAINATIAGISEGKKAFGKMIAAAVPYKKKSYHSILVPAKEVNATFRIFLV